MFVSFLNKKDKEKNRPPVRLKIDNEIDLFLLGYKPAILLSMESMRDIDCVKLYYDKDSNNYKNEYSDEFNNINPPTLGFKNEQIKSLFLKEENQGDMLGFYLGYPPTAVNMFLENNTIYTETKEEVLFNGLKFIGNSEFRQEIELELMEMYPNLPFEIQYMNICSED